MSTNAFLEKSEIASSADMKEKVKNGIVKSESIRIKFAINNNNYEIGGSISYFDGTDGYCISKEDLTKFVQKIHMCNIFGHIVINDHPDFLKLCKKVGVDDFDLPVLEMPYLLKSIDPRIPTVYISQNHCKRYVLRCLKKEKVPFKKVNELPNSDVERSCINFYINCYLSCLPRDIFNSMLSKLQECTYPILVKLATPSDESKLADQSKNTKAEIMFYGFFGINSIAKKSAINSIGKMKDNGRSINVWIENKTNVLFDKCGFNQYLYIPDISGDLMTMAKFLDFNLDVRRILFEPLLIGNISTKTGDKVWSAFRSYTRILQSFTGLKTLQLAYEFSEACETYAHTNITIVEESNKVLEIVKSMKEKCGANLDYQFYYIMYGQENKYEVKKYKNLAYCATFKKKIDNPGSSWDNFTSTVRDTNIPEETLKDLTMTPLDIDKYLNRK